MRFAIRVLVFLGLLWAGTLVLGSTAERWLIYPFDGTRIAPGSVGLGDVQEMSFRSDGETLIAWIAAPKPGKPTVFYLHGNAGNLAARAGRFRQFRTRGYGLFALAYRGSGGSSGTPSEAAILRDVRAAWDTHRARFPDIAPGTIILYGESLGTAATLSLFDTGPWGSDPPGGVIVEAPFTSIADMAQAQ